MTTLAVYGDLETDSLRLFISNRPTAEARYRRETAQDINGRNFIPQCDLARYYKRTRVYSCKRTTLSQKRCRLFSQQLAESGIALR